MNENLVADLIKKHYQYETASEIAHHVVVDLGDNHNYHATMQDEEQIVDMINEYTYNIIF